MGIIKRDDDGTGALGKLRRQKEIHENIDSGRYTKAGEEESLVIALDGSASMLGHASEEAHPRNWGGHEYREYARTHFSESKWVAAVRAIKMLVERSRSSSVGLVIFDDLVLASLPVGVSKADFEAILDSQAPRRGTCFATALSESLRLLEEAPSRPVRRVILLSDGHDGLHLGLTEYTRQLHLCIIRKVIVDTVGFGDADERTLRQIARETGGIYKHARDAAELVETFKRLEAGVRGLLGQ